VTALQEYRHYLYYSTKCWSFSCYFNFLPYNL